MLNYIQSISSDHHDVTCRICGITEAGTIKEKKMALITGQTNNVQLRVSVRGMEQNQ